MMPVIIKLMFSSEMLQSIIVKCLITISGEEWVYSRKLFNDLASISEIFCWTKNKWFLSIRRKSGLGIALISSHLSKYFFVAFS